MHDGGSGFCERSSGGRAQAARKPAEGGGHVDIRPVEEFCLSHASEASADGLRGQLPVRSECMRATYRTHTRGRDTA
eukprot:4942087-Prymnesium_polylepis.3